MSGRHPGPAARERPRDWLKQEAKAHLHSAVAIPRNDPVEIAVPEIQIRVSEIRMV